jgi:hypothetical protein
VRHDLIAALSIWGKTAEETLRTWRPIVGDDYVGVIDGPAPRLKPRVRAPGGS